MCRFSLFAKSRSASARLYTVVTIIRCRLTVPVANSFRQAKRLSYNSFQIGEQRGLRFLVGQRFGALLAAFHDELVQLRIDGQGIIAVETSKAKPVQRFSCRANHLFHIKVTET